MMEVAQRLSEVIVIEDMGLSCRDVSQLRRRSFSSSFLLVFDLSLV